MKELIKWALKAAAPKQYSVWATMRANRHGQRVMTANGVPAVAAALAERYGLRVLSGPFEGMAYIRQSVGSSFTPKLLGSYECELHGALRRILGTEYDTVVDVGSAEGFYAVGLALFLSGEPSVYAYDIDAAARRQCLLLARQNGLEGSIRVGGRCDAPQLQKVLHGRALVVCDCEGYERDLLDVEQAPSLQNADILVELHDLFRPGTTTALTERFSATHEIELIDTAVRDPNAYPAVSFLPPRERQVALSEFRNGPQQWAFMTPKGAMRC